MDILYIIGEGVSRCDYFDLRCSLRSLSQYGEGIDRVFVAGFCPFWLSDKVVKIPFTQPFGTTEDIIEKHINIQETIRYVVDNTDISDEFFVSMSDHYLTKPVDFSNCPYCCQLTELGTLIPEARKNTYYGFIADTKKYLQSKGLSVLFTTIHRNMKVSRESVLACAEYFDEIADKKIAVEPFLLLGNWEYTHGKSKENIAYYKDYKVFSGSQWWKSSPELTDTFSTSPFLYGAGLYSLLKGMYGKKCEYEN